MPFHADFLTYAIPGKVREPVEKRYQNWLFGDPHDPRRHVRLGEYDRVARVLGIDMAEATPN